MRRQMYSCGLDAALSVVSGRWKFLVIWHLSVHEPLRFGQLRRLVEGVSEKMLMSALKELESDGAIRRVDFQERPPRVEYSLTTSGMDLAEALRPLCRWGHTHASRQIAAAPEPL